MPSRKRLHHVAGLVGLGFALAAALLWVVTATGQLAYVATHGTSMHPRFHHGDLAVVRPASAYQVGDVVAYHSRSLDAVVLHRIVARDGDRYVLKGDANSWLDRDRPTSADLIGGLWFHVPDGGNVLAALRGRTLVFALATLLFVGGGTATASRRRRRRPKGTTSSMFDITRTRLHTWRAATVGLSAVALAAATLGVAAMNRPATTTATAPANYTQAGEFTYRAAAPAGAVYETGHVSTGDPVYLRLVPAVDVAFAYSFAPTGAGTASGTIALGAELSDGTGWTRHVELQPARSFDGESAEANGRLAVTDLQALVAEVRSATGVQAASATVTLVPDVRVTATVDGARVRDRFQPRLTFQLDPLQLRLAQATGEPRTTADDSLRPRREGTVRPSKTVPTRLELAGHGLTVTDARRVGLGAVPFALAALVSGLVLRRRLRPETARIELRHGHRIVPVAAAEGDADVDVVDVTRIEDLARLAEQEGCLILHQRNTNGDVYLFQTDRTIYRYMPRHNLLTRPVSA